MLVGDAGERDAETFAGIYREYPDRISKIFIRDVTRLGPGGIRMRDVNERGNKQLEFVDISLTDIPGHMWSMFTDADLIMSDLGVRQLLSNHELSVLEQYQRGGLPPLCEPILAFQSQTDGGLDELPTPVSAYQLAPTSPATYSQPQPQPQMAPIP
jgi:hypothetical protein